MFCLARQTRRTGEFLLPCALACLLWAASALSYRHHFAQLDENMHQRLYPMPSAYLATEPKLSNHGVLFVAMQNEGYRAMDQNGLPLGDGLERKGADILSVATNSRSSTVVVEVADAGGSWLSKTSNPSLPLVRNAESPALSQDGSEVMFIRETKGRGTLWSKTAQQSPVQLTDATFDVRNFSLASSGWIVFSAKVEGKMSLFQRKPDGAVTDLAIGLSDTDEPAISPDEQRIAFTTEIGDRRQVAVLDRKTGKSSTLTRGDCNQYRPEWLNMHSIAYATDCGRGLGLTALAAVEAGP
jgi:Tol biopolymer transport system component